MKKLLILSLLLCLCLVLAACTQTGDVCTHVDNDKNGVCDLCEDPFGSCAHLLDKNKDGKCDGCGKIVGECQHSDINRDERCDKCDLELSGSGAVDNCKHSLYRVTLEIASCTKGEVYYEVCSKCPYKSEEKTLDNALGHNWQRTVSANALISEANCTSPALYYRTCADCGEVGGTPFTSGMPLGHNFVKIASSETLSEAATCTHGDLYFTTCSVCGEQGDLFELGQKSKHADTNSDFMCDFCNLALKEWEGDVPSDNKTHVDTLKKGN